MHQTIEDFTARARGLRERICAESDEIIFWTNRFKFSSLRGAHPKEFLNVAKVLEIRCKRPLSDAARGRRLCWHVSCSCIFNSPDDFYDIRARSLSLSPQFHVTHRVAHNHSFFFNLSLSPSLSFNLTLNLTHSLTLSQSHTLSRSLSI